jgi:hypothetical protein
MKKLSNLPKSDDEYFEGAEKYTSPNKRIPMCSTHGKNWIDHKGYIDNGDGTGSCTVCCWGFMIPGYIRIYEGRAYDLRSAAAKP